LLLFFALNKRRRNKKRNKGQLNDYSHTLLPFSPYFVEETHNTTALTNTKTKIEREKERERIVVLNYKTQRHRDIVQKDRKTDRQTSSCGTQLHDKQVTQDLSVGYKSQDCN
jgi:hypothetical protein